MYKWQVDMISMSFGLSDEAEQGCDELTRAIVAAHVGGILMFARSSDDIRFLMNNVLAGTPLKT
jgi:hypothetical protein